MLVRRPAGPVAGERARDSGDKTASVDVGAEEDVDVAMRSGSAGREVEFWVREDVGVGDELDGVVAVYGRGTFDEVNSAGCRDRDGLVLRDVETVVCGKREALVFDRDGARAGEADQASLLFGVGEGDAVGVEGSRRMRP